MPITDHGLASLAPPLVALALALATRHVILSLAVGVFGGFTILAGYNPLLGFIGLIEQGLFLQLSEPSHAALIVLILIIGGFIGLLEKSGGMKAFAQQIAAWVKGPVGAQLAVWLSGMGIFFSDSATPLILGPIFRPVLARVGVSREKLAYIVDSTASPVCVLVPFISWGVYVMSLMDQGFATNGITANSFATFVQMLPMQYYPVLALVAVPLIITSRREFGPMARAEAHMGDDVCGVVAGDTGHPGSRLIVVPMITLFLAVAGMFAASYAMYGELSGKSLKTSLVVAYLVATAVTVWLLRRGDVMNLGESMRCFRRGVEKMLLISLILILAWSLGRTCQQLGTGRFLARVTKSFLTPGLLSPALFVIGAVISFAMGSAWGTFAILMPMAISMAHGMGASLLPPMSAVLSGGLFGDHASPISDTTILASMGAGCKHIDHVRTQLPYALTSAGIALCSFYAASVWQSPWVMVVAVMVLCMVIFGVMFRFGKPLKG